MAQGSSHSIKSFLERLTPSPKGGKHSLLFLNIAQFLGVINDNVFKLVMAFLLIEALGYAQTSKILSATGAIYVIPFLLFSSSAGILADRFSKQKLLVGMKCAEIIIMILAIFAFGSKNVFGCFSLLFLLSVHSALFGPSKYGIIPELVPQEAVSRANGLVTSFTYLAIIVGTFLASFLTDMTNHHFVMIALFCLCVAVGGLIAALAIHKTAPQGSNKKMNFLFVREIYYTLKGCRATPHLLPSIFGSAFFLFIGGFTQLNIIPFAIQALSLSEVFGGYLFLATALGIALGSILAGKASRKQVELGLSCLAGFGIALFLLLLKVFSLHLYPVIFCLFMIGVLGGAFIVPFDTFIQLNSTQSKRGQTIGAVNFLSFTGVLIASFALYLFNQVFGFSAATSFAVLSGITFLAACFLTLRLSELTLYYFSRKCLKPLCHYKHPRIEEIEKVKSTILVLEKFTWKKAFLLSSSFPNTHFFLATDSKKWHWFFYLFSNIHPMRPNTALSVTTELLESFIEQRKTPCLLLEGTIPFESQVAARGFFDFFKKSRSQITFAHLIQEKDSKSRTYHFVEKTD